MNDALASPYAMSRDELNAFLTEVRFASVTTLRKDGSPLTIALGYDWDGDSLFLSIRNTRTIVRRLARDPRVCVTVYNSVYPPVYAILEGCAEPCDDPGYERSRKLQLKYMAPDSPAMSMKGLDLEEFWRNWTGVGRKTYSIRPARITTEDANKRDDHAKVGGAGISDARAKARGEL